MLNSLAEKQKARPNGLGFLMYSGSPTWARTRDLRINRRTNHDGSAPLTDAAQATPCIPQYFPKRINRISTFFANLPRTAPILTLRLFTHREPDLRPRRLWAPWGKDRASSCRSRSRQACAKPGPKAGKLHPSRSRASYSATAGT